MRLGRVIAIVFCFVVATATCADAHVAFKKALSKKYPEMKITCNACHVDKKPKSERNEFGKLFAKELKDKKLTESFKSKSDIDERKKYVKEVMTPEFVKALDKIKKTKPKDQKLTYDELIKAGEIKEITKKPIEKKDE